MFTLRIFVIFAFSILSLQLYGLKITDENENIRKLTKVDQSQDKDIQAFGSANGALIAPRLYISAISQNPADKDGLIHFYNEEGEIIESGKVIQYIHLKNTTDEFVNIEDFETFKPIPPRRFSIHPIKDLALYIFEKPIKKIKPYKIHPLAKKTLLFKDKADKHPENNNPKYKENRFNWDIESFVYTLMDKDWQDSERRMIGLDFPNKNEVLRVDRVVEELRSSVTAELKSSTTYELESVDSGSPAIAYNRSGRLGLYGILVVDSDEIYGKKMTSQKVYLLHEFPQIEKLIDYYTPPQNFEEISKTLKRGVARIVRPENQLNLNDLVVGGATFKQAGYEMEIFEKYPNEYFIHIFNDMFIKKNIYIRLENSTIVVKNSASEKFNEELKVTLITKRGKDKKEKTYVIKNENRFERKIDLKDFVKNPDVLKIEIKKGEDSVVFDISDAIEGPLKNWLFENVKTVSQKQSVQTKKQTTTKTSTRLKADDDDTSSDSEKTDKNTQLVDSQKTSSQVRKPTQDSDKQSGRSATRVFPKDPYKTYNDRVDGPRNIEGLLLSRTLDEAKYEKFISDKDPDNDQIEKKLKVGDKEYHPGLYIPKEHGNNTLVKHIIVHEMFPDNYTNFDILEKELHFYSLGSDEYKLEILMTYVDPKKGPKVRSMKDIQLNDSSKGMEILTLPSKYQKADNYSIKLTISKADQELSFETQKKRDDSESESSSYETDSDSDSEDFSLALNSRYEGKSPFSKIFKSDSKSESRSPESSSESNEDLVITDTVEPFLSSEVADIPEEDDTEEFNKFLIKGYDYKPVPQRLTANVGQNKYASGVMGWLYEDENGEDKPGLAIFHPFLKKGSMTMQKDKENYVIRMGENNDIVIYAISKKGDNTKKVAIYPKNGKAFIEPEKHFLKGADDMRLQFVLDDVYDDVRDGIEGKVYRFTMEFDPEDFIVEE